MITSMLKSKKSEIVISMLKSKKNESDLLNVQDKKIRENKSEIIN